MHAGWNEGENVQFWVNYPFDLNIKTKKVYPISTDTNKFKIYNIKLADNWHGMHHSFLNVIYFQVEIYYLEYNNIENKINP